MSYMDARGAQLRQDLARIQADYTYVTHFEENATMRTYYFDVTIIDSRDEDDATAITVYGVRASDAVAAKIAAIIRAEYGEHELKFLDVHVDSKCTVQAVVDDGD